MGQSLQFTGLLSSLASGPSSKRRLPGGSSFGAASNTRDPKSRRREDPTRSSGGVSVSGGGWSDGKEGKKEKEELVDMSLVELLRKGP